MRLLLPAVALTALLALAPDADAQRAAQTTASRSDIVVVPSMAGEALRITTARNLPSARQSLRRYRGLRVYRPTARRGAIVPAQPVAPAVYTARGERFVKRGGSYFYTGDQ